MDQLAQDNLDRFRGEHEPDPDPQPGVQHPHRGGGLSAYGRVVWARLRLSTPAILLMQGESNLGAQVADQGGSPGAHGR